MRACIESYSRREPPPLSNSPATHRAAAGQGQRKLLKSVDQAQLGCQASKSGTARNKTGGACLKQVVWYNWKKTSGRGQQTRATHLGKPGVSILKLCILASSSAGNSVFLSTGRTRILIDAGISRRELVKRLASIGEDVSELDAVLLTHEHSDHTAGLATLVKASGGRLPIYLTHRTAPCLEWGEVTPALELFQAGCGFSIGDFDVASFTIPHDAADPVGYTVCTQGIKVGLATDLGYIPDSLRVHFRDTDVLLLESNHDLEMLRVGPYPWSVKQRVMSRRGHLSNEVTAGFVREDLDTRVSTLILGHISEHNNHPELVRKMGYEALRGRTLFTRLVVAEPGSCSEVFCY